MLKPRILIVLALLMLLVPFVGVAAQAGTVVDVAAGNADFSTLADLVTKAGLAETLSGEGPFTLFAPTNEAFAKLPQPVLDYLAANPDVLARVLTYHVVPQNIAGVDTLAMTEATAVATVEGGSLSVVFDGTTVKVNDANVVILEVAASNGVIHGIDTVLVPSFDLPEVIPAILSGDVVADGSSTVEPLALAIAKQFTDEGFGGNVQIGESGTGGGFKAFCEEGVTDIANASRAIKTNSDPATPEEAEKCAAINRVPVPFRVGTDGIAIVVNPENTWATDLTSDEIVLLFSTAVNWSDVRADFPAEPIIRYVPGTDSGTWDFFIEKFYDQDDAAALAASELNQSENDNVLVQGVEGNKNAVGFFGYAYYNANSDKLTAVAIDSVLPTFETVEGGSYKLARPLYVYSDPTIMQDKPQVAGFINFFLQNVNNVIDEVGYFPASEAALNRAKLYFLAATNGGM